jgi:hypothetical protein
MNHPARSALIFAVLAAMFAGAQSSKEAAGPGHEAQVRGYWKDRSTGLMWAGKDNGKDVRWKKAVNYCRDLRLGGYSDWRLATIEELQGIYDKNAEAPGLAGPHRDEPFTFHVKGNLFLTGDQWSMSRTSDERGRATGYAWYFNFNEGRQMTDELSFSTNKHALCVREYRG